MQHLFATAALLAAAPCTVPNPGYCPTPSHYCDASIDGPVDGPADGPKIRVSAATGDDTKDGITAPVKTLKHALELVAPDGAPKIITLDAGKYDAANGETFSYTVPRGVKISGAPGTTLAGTAAQAGIAVSDATLENLQFDNFTMALRTTGTAMLTGITVNASGIGLLADGAASVTATALNFHGAAACGNVGVLALGTAKLTIDTFVATDVIAVREGDQASVSIKHGTVTGNSQCKLIIAGGVSLELTDTNLSGGIGLFLDRMGAQLAVTLVNTTISDAPNNAITGRARVFQMTGGALRNNENVGAGLSGGTYTFTNVSITANAGVGIYVDSDTEQTTIKMRGCTITNNGKGIGLKDAIADLGTTAERGGNTVRDNSGVGLSIEGTSAKAVTAVGNAWRQNVQGADADGKYFTQPPRVGPVAQAAGNNYAISGPSTLQF